MLMAGLGPAFWMTWLPANVVLACTTTLIVWVVLPRQPRNWAVWALGWSGVFSGLFVGLIAACSVLLQDLGLPTDYTAVAPAQVPPGLAVILVLGSAMYLPSFVGPTFGYLVFPDGHLLNKRWRWAVASLILAVLMLFVGTLLAFPPSGTVAIGADFGAHPPIVRLLFSAGLLLVFSSLIAALISLVIRYRLSSGELRQQLRWIAWGQAIGVLALIGANLFYTESAVMVGTLRFAGVVAWLGTYGVALARYRLYDIDLVISRTFVYGSLALFITVAYVGVVVGVGRLLDLDSSNQALAVMATALVALTFQPLRQRLQKVANRLVYGRRSTPYEVLSRFSQGVAASDRGLIGLVARSLVEGTTAEAAVIWVGNPGEQHVEAAWPVTPEDPATLMVPIIHDREQLGAVGLYAPRDQVLGPMDERLVNSVATGMGLALRNLSLSDDLRARVVELRESRRRIVAVQNETRRNLERDLHDGAQQQLVAIKVKLGLARQLATKGGALHTAEQLGALVEQADHAIQTTREFARGIYPPLLEAEGLGVAITAHVHRLPLESSVAVSGVDRHPQEIEATTYFCVVQALADAIARGATHASIAIEEAGDGIVFTVEDDGDAATQGTNVGIADRIDALGGELEVVSGGRRVVGRLSERALDFV